MADRAQDPERFEQDANRLALLSRWADDLAHEIKNPLHAMVINLELVKRRAGGSDPTPLIERAEVVESELHRVHALVDSLLKLVRPWPDARSSTVQQVFDALIPVIHARARIRQVEYTHEPGVAIVAISPGDLAQVLVNLVDNAIDATPEGGRVTTAVGTDGHQAWIRIRDTGPGLTDGVDSPHGRSGLGLPVTRRLLDRAGGSLRLSNVEGGGAEATISLPCTGSA